MVQIDITYQGDLRCQAKHLPSGTILATDAPVDNMGRGESFSPTDLVATALGTCILTTMAIVAQRRGIDFSSARYTVEKHMLTEPDRRIGGLPVTIRMSATITPENRAVLERAAHTCPVNKSIHPDVEAPITF